MLNLKHSSPEFTNKNGHRSVRIIIIVIIMMMMMMMMIIIMITIIITTDGN